MTPIEAATAAIRDSKFSAPGQPRWQAAELAIAAVRAFLDEAAASNRARNAVAIAIAEGSPSDPGRSAIIALKEAL